MDNLDVPSVQLISTARAICRRRVVGIDLCLERPYDEGQTLAIARSAASATHLRLVAAMAEEPDERVVRAGTDGGLRLRFIARSEDVHVADEAICELLTSLPGALRWSRLAKLEEFDGIPDFSPLPAL